MSEIPPPTIPPATPPPPGGGSYTPPPPPPPYGGGGQIGGPGGPVSSDRSLMIALSYLPFLALIPYLTKKNDPDAEVRWHSKNGMGLFAVDVIVLCIYFVLGWVFSNSIIGCGVAAAQCVISLGLLALHIFCLIKAINGQRVRIPVVTDFAEKNL